MGGSPPWETPPWGVRVQGSMTFNRHTQKQPFGLEESFPPFFQPGELFGGVRRLQPLPPVRHPFPVKKKSQAVPLLARKKSIYFSKSNLGSLFKGWWVLIPPALPTPHTNPPSAEENPFFFAYDLQGSLFERGGGFWTPLFAPPILHKKNPENPKFWQKYPSFFALLTSGRDGCRYQILLLSRTQKA